MSSNTNEKKLETDTAATAVLKVFGLADELHGEAASKIKGMQTLIANYQSKPTILEQLQKTGHLLHLLEELEPLLKTCEQITIVSQFKTHVVSNAAKIAVAFYCDEEARQIKSSFSKEFDQGLVSGQP